MEPEVVAAKPTGGYRVWLRFSDGLEGEIDLGDLLWGPVFEPLKDEKAFAELQIDPDWGTIVWPGGADVAPESLRARLEKSKSGSRAAE